MNNGAPKRETHFYFKCLDGSKLKIELKFGFVGGHAKLTSTKLVTKTGATVMQNELSPYDAKLLNDEIVWYSASHILEHGPAILQHEWNENAKRKGYKV